ncbi:hypothetical protein JMN32_14850 [Fulvivirga sp. 29W222]|uniref:Viral A-type inclusion protein n=1 Tax=Fulvivirga marina TaxID=2494733 RepID=A0A937FWY3_9BACT|nr:hypothetical protein [Fulvivirga marina]MBL6447594.1 hypothetical protein [Fulvivirga marina]
MKTVKYMSLAFVILGLLSCNNTETKKDNAEDKTITKAEETYNEAIKVHDEIMPWMDRIQQIKDELQHLKDSIPQDSVQIDLHIQKLEDADKAMMAWMHGLKQYPKDHSPNHHDHGEHNSKMDTTLEIHMSQKKQIIEVKQMMQDAMKEAEDLIQIKE